MAGARSKSGSDERYLSGRNAVREALVAEASQYHRLLLSKSVAGAFGREIRARAQTAHVPVQVVPPQKLDSLLPGVNHQGVALALSAVTYLSVHDLLSQTAPTNDDVRDAKPILLILDHIQDPYNLGAIIRSAAGAGVAGIILPERDAAPVNAAALKTSAGAALHMPIARTGRLSDVLQELKERGYWVVGADGSARESVWELDWDRPLAIVIGSEEKGMRPGTAAACDHRVSIPLRGAVESLNASVAAGVILFAAARTRPGSGN